MRFWEARSRKMTFIRVFQPLNPIHRRCANSPDSPSSRKALDSGKMRHKRPFPAPPMFLITVHADQRPPNHPRTRRQPWAKARRVWAHPQADRAGADIHRARNFFGDVERALLVQIL